MKSFFFDNKHLYSVLTSTTKPNCDERSIHSDKMTMIRLVSAFVLIFGTTAVTGFNLQRSVVVTSTRQQLDQNPNQRWPVVVLVPSATTSSNEEATTTATSTSSITDDSNAGTTSTATDVDTTTSNTKLPHIVMTGHNIELTASLVEYINKRIGNILSKLANHGAVRECDVVLSVNKNPKVKPIIYCSFCCGDVDSCYFFTQPLWCIHSLIHIGQEWTSGRNYHECEGDDDHM